VGYRGEFVTNLGWLRRGDAGDPTESGNTLGSLDSNAFSETGH
jgi:hypothetical protein